MKKTLAEDMADGKNLSEMARKSCQNIWVPGCQEIVSKIRKYLPRLLGVRHLGQGSNQDT